MKKIWYILTNKKKFRVISPFYTSEMLTFKEAVFMKKIFMMSRIVMVD